MDRASVHGHLSRFLHGEIRMLAGEAWDIASGWLPFLGIHLESGVHCVLVQIGQK